MTIGLISIYRTHMTHIVMRYHCTYGRWLCERARVRASERKREGDREDTREATEMREAFAPILPPSNTTEVCAPDMPSAGAPNARLKRLKLQRMAYLGRRPQLCLGAAKSVIEDAKIHLSQQALLCAYSHLYVCISMRVSKKAQACLRA